MWTKAKNTTHAKKEGKWRNFDKSCLINAFLNEMGFGAETRMFGREFQTRMTLEEKKKWQVLFLLIGI